MYNLKTDNNLKRRILLVTRPIAPPWDEASKNFAYNLAINSPGFEFSLLTNGIMKNLPGHIRQLPIYSSNKLTWDQRLNLLKLIHHKKDFDILHFMLTPTKINTLSFKTFINNRKSKTIQTVATLREDLFSDAEIKKLMFADRIITYSKYAKAKLNSLGLSNVEQIYPGIDLSLYSPSTKDPELLKKLNLSPTDFIVTFPGEFTRLGGTDDLVRMISQNKDALAEKNIKIVFACRVKDEKDRIKKEEIKKIFNDSSMPNLIRLPDTFQNLSAVFNSSDLVIFPVSNMHGKFDVPLAVIEAMACAKPVIISDIPILREFSNHENSAIIESGNMKKLMDVIMEFRQSSEKTKMVGSNARKFVEENFDIKKTALHYAEIYKNINIK
jgi:glycosyltransferase involved in cell wall biosynthesis